MNLLTVMVLGCSLLLTADTPTKSKTTDIPALVENPNQYFYGTILFETVFEHEKRIYTAVQVHPVAEQTQMYDEQLTFCGNQKEKFRGVTQQLVVLVFSKHMRPQACFNLVRVDIVDSYHNGSQWQARNQIDTNALGE